MSEKEVEQLIYDAVKITLKESMELGEEKTGSGILKVKMGRLKDFAVDSLPEWSTLKKVLLSEKDEMDVKEFVAKMEIWLKLLRMEFS